MTKEIGKEYKNKREREAFLKDNCDAVVEMGYMKPYTQEELQEHKEKLANVSIEIAELEAKKKEQDAIIKGELKPLKESRSLMVSNIKSKAEYVKEICYKFVDQEARQAEVYNSEGDLVELRPATAEELQPNIFSIARKTGTDDI